MLKKYRNAGNMSLLFVLCLAVLSSADRTIASDNPSIPILKAFASPNEVVNIIADANLNQMRAKNKYFVSLKEIWALSWRYAGPCWKFSDETNVEVEDGRWKISGKFKGTNKTKKMAFPTFEYMIIRSEKTAKNGNKNGNTDDGVYTVTGDSHDMENRNQQNIREANNLCFIVDNDKITYINLHGRVILFKSHYYCNINGNINIDFSIKKCDDHAF